MDINNKKIISLSTSEFAREARRVPGFRVFDFLHGYVYLRWPYLYISIGKGEHLFAHPGQAIRCIRQDLYAIAEPQWLRIKI